MSKKRYILYIIPIIVIIVIDILTIKGSIPWFQLEAPQKELLSIGKTTDATAERIPKRFFEPSALYNVKVSYTVDYDDDIHTAKTSLSDKDIEKVFGESDEAIIEVFYHEDYPDIVSNEMIVKDYEQLTWIITMTPILVVFFSIVALYIGINLMVTGFKGD